LAWKTTYKPFHWLIEFYGIINGGGFDVIVGNPPYIELSKVKSEYTIRGYATESGGNLYGLFIEHATRISSETTLIGLIVPISVMCTERTIEVQRQVLTKRSSWVSTFDVFPARVFEGAAQRVSIVIASNNAHDAPHMFTTRYLRWFQQERPTLIEGLQYADTTGLGKPGWLPRLGSAIEASILRRLTGLPLSGQINRDGGSSIYAHRIINNFVKAMNFAPFFKKADGTVTTSDDFKIVRVEKGLSGILISILNSSLFYWYWRAHGDGFHCGYRDIGMFPLDMKSIVGKHKIDLERLADRLSQSLEKNSEIRTRNQKATGLVHLQTFFVGKSKSIIDEIDQCLADYLKLDPVEVDQIINYDIKYRMGADEGDGE
jgi:hypothetical protein